MRFRSARVNHCLPKTRSSMIGQRMKPQTTPAANTRWLGVSMPQPKSSLDGKRSSFKKASCSNHKIPEDSDPVAAEATIGDLLIKLWATRNCAVSTFHSGHIYIYIKYWDSFWPGIVQLHPPPRRAYCISSQKYTIHSGIKHRGNPRRRFFQLRTLL